MKSIEDVYLFLKKRESLGIKLGLERMNTLLKKLNHPEKHIKFIHVAGTNGKGSTVHMLAATLIAHDYRIGVFSSPSFSGLTGHFVINNESISEKLLIRLMNDIVPIVKQLDEQGNAPTPFEIITALSFLYFKDRVDIAIIETGMGGRYDTTNSITPLLSVITTIALDHEQYLGQTIEEISRHKAGIIKQNRPIIVGPVNDEAFAVIKKEADEKDAKLIRFNTHYSLQHENNRYVWLGPNHLSLTLRIQLQGRHQFENASIVLMILYYLRNENYFEIDWNVVMQSLYKVEMVGRFEVVSTNPYIIVDSAHNIAGINAFINTAKKYITRKKGRLLFAAFRDKRLDDMIGQLRKENFEIILTTFSHERAADKADFAPILEKDHKLIFTKQWQNEITRFLTNSERDDILFITGSLHFVMLARNYIHQFYRNKTNE